MRLRKNQLYEIAESIEEHVGSKTLLDDLLKAMSDNELQSNLEFIDRMYGLGIFDTFNSFDNEC